MANKNSASNYETVVGLEVHAQLTTDSKAFCGCSTNFGADENTNTCPVCLALPGALPVLNKKVVEYAIRLGLSTKCEKINLRSIFARKNYFYPDLPKGYQISQYEEPICENGQIEIIDNNNTSKTIGLTRIHIEEDTGKSIHEGNKSYINLNRCGVPLLEIVSEPDMRSPQEAYLYLKKLHSILTFLKVCDGNLEEGNFRCDANVSVRKPGEKELRTKTEVKNINSFKFIEKAIQFEIERQIEVYESGGTIDQQTLTWDSTKKRTVLMRKKEQAHDYRYFPEPDLLPLVITEDWIEEIKSTLPKLQDEIVENLVKDFGIKQYDAQIISQSEKSINFFREGLNSGFEVPPQDYATWMNVGLNRKLNENGIDIDESPLSPKQLASIVYEVDEGNISSTAGNLVLDKMVNTKKMAEEIIEEEGLKQVSDSSALRDLVDEIITSNPQQVEQYRGGKVKLFGFFVGQAMKKSKGKANPKVLNDIIKEKLEKV